MVMGIFKVILSACVISFSSWLSGKKPALAGFIMALPLSTLLALVFSYGEYQDVQKTSLFAKSIFYSVPLSLLFFVPFLFAEKLRWPFWGLYLSGLVLLAGGYGIHRVAFKY